MGSIIQNNIKSLSRLYLVYLEQEDIMITTVMENHIRGITRRGNYVFWSERQMQNILRQFHHITTKKKQLLSDIHQLYLHKIDVTEDEDEKYSVVTAFVDFVKRIWTKSPKWMETLKVNLPYVKQIVPCEMMVPIFYQAALRIRIKYDAENDIFRRE